MYTEGFEQWFKVNKNMMSPLSDANRTAAEIFRRTLQQHAELLSEHCYRLGDQLKRISKIGSPEELFNLHKDILSENMTAAIENMQRMVNIQMQNVEEYTHLWGAWREPMMAAAKAAEKTAERTTDKMRERSERHGEKHHSD